MVRIHLALPYRFVPQIVGGFATIRKGLGELKTFHQRGIPLASHSSIVAADRGSLYGDNETQDRVHIRPILHTWRDGESVSPQTLRYPVRIWGQRPEVI